MLKECSTLGSSAVRENEIYNIQEEKSLQSRLFNQAKNSCCYMATKHLLARHEKMATDLASFTRSAKSIFSKRFSTSLSSMISLRSLKYVWLHLSHRIMSRKRGLAAEYCSKWRQRSSNLETNFTRKTYTLEAET